MCGPAKAHRLGLLAAAADPQRFVTLTRAAAEPSEALRRLKIVSQALRRAGKGWEYLAVPERHQNGFWHLHLLQRGDFIPVRELSGRAESAGMGRVVWIERVQGGPHAVAAYLVKYLTKDAGDDRPPGARRYTTSRSWWPGGKAAVEARVFGRDLRGDDQDEAGSWTVMRGCWFS